METELLTTNDAARLLNVSTVTLEKWRGQGKGPEYVKMGRAVRYKRDALEEFIKEKTIEP
jgi:excisionase family DNA binding protein